MSSPLPTSSGPAAAAVAASPEPNAERAAPTACVETGATPVHDVIESPPSEIACEKFARTAWTVPSVGTVTFVAMYEAVVTPPAVTDCTSVYLLPSGV